MTAGKHLHADASTKDRQFASTLARGIDILLCYQVGESALGNKDFVERTGLSKTTVARLTHTLTVLGYLRHDTALRKYRLGAPVLSMSYPLLANMHIRQIARPLMKELADYAHCAVSLGIRDRTHMVYVDTARSTNSLIMTPDIGAPLPMMTTAIGKAWLCKAPAAERESVLNQIRVNDPAHFERYHAEVMHARQMFERYHYCSNQGEWRSDVYGFGVPLSKPVDSNLFVFNCGISAAQGSYASLERQVAPRLVALVRHVEALLGLS